MKETNEVVRVLVADIQSTMKTEKRGVISNEVAYDTSYYKVDGVKLALSVIDPEGVYIVLDQLKTLLVEYYAGTKEQREIAEKILQNVRV